MPPTTRQPVTTAADLLAAVRACGVRAEGDGLQLDADPPPDAAEALPILHTAIRAVLTGRRWVGCGSSPRTAAPRVLNPALPIPAGTTLLCVEGDGSWDRIRPDASDERPDLFEQAEKKKSPDGEH